MTFLLDSIKDSIGVEEDESPGFDDMNYVVGNTSGMDIGQVPSPIDQRIGRMAQIGGAVQELQITNPTTFQIDRRELLNVINQLGIDVTLHGDPNIGFTAAYATRGQGITGYNIVHRYMKRYIEQMAAFKYEVRERDELDFDLGYVNMHASNEQIPPREERLASDISVDPFGKQLTDLTKRGDVDIYQNRDFMRELFDYFFLEIVERPFRLYEQIFSDTDDEFKKKWDDGKKEKANEIYRRQSKAEDKVSLLQTASGIDQELETTFLNKLDHVKLPSSFTLRAQDEEREFRTLGDVADQLTRPGGRPLLESPQRLSRDIYRIRQKDLNMPVQTGPMAQPQNIPIDQLEGNFKADSVLNAISKLVDTLWLDEGISAEAKLTALTRNLDIQQSAILEDAEKLDYVEEAAREAFADPENDEILENLVSGRYRDDFNKESSIFFHIMPAWMQNASESHGEKHPGWEAPEFIWDSIVGERFESYDEYEEFLDDRRENELDVIAAVGAAYIWGHWTQVRDEFDTQAFRAGNSEIKMPELKQGSAGKYTWAEWMNKFNLTLNIEAMYGDPGQLRRVWRPKDIAVVCRAINRTAERQSEAWDEDFRGPVAKFTLDMEHTASYGVDPFQEVQTLIEQQKEVSDEEKPLADIMKTYHLTKPGWEQQQGHRHGPFARGDETLYEWLYKLVEAGFARNQEEESIVMFEVGGEYREETYVIRVAMDMIERGMEPEDLNPNKIPVDGEYETPEQALMARFFGLDRNQFNSEMTKIEEHAFDPLDGLLEAEGFDYTWSGQSAIEEGGNRPNEWKQEEYR